MTGRTIRGDILFEAGSINPTEGWDNTKAENGISLSIARPFAIIDLLHNFHFQVIKT